MALPATDTFTGNNGTALPTYSANWTNASNGMRIETNRATGISESSVMNMAWWDADSFAAAHYTKAMYAGTVTAGVAPGVAVRCQSGAVSMYYAICDNVTCYRGECIAGNASDWDSGSVVAINDVIELRINETVTTTVYFYKNAGLVSTYTSKTALSGGVAGVCCWAGISAVGVDNWEGGDTGGGSPTVRPRAPIVIRQAVRRAAFF